MFYIVEAVHPLFLMLAPADQTPEAEASFTMHQVWRSGDFCDNFESECYTREEAEEYIAKRTKLATY